MGSIDGDGGGLADAEALETEVGQHGKGHRRVGRAALRQEPHVLEPFVVQMVESRHTTRTMADAGQGDVPEALPRARAIHGGRLVVLGRHALERGEEGDDPEREAPPEGGDDHAGHRERLRAQEVHVAVDDPETEQNQVEGAALGAYRSFQVMKATKAGIAHGRSTRPRHGAGPGSAG